VNSKTPRGSICSQRSLRSGRSFDLAVFIVRKLSSPSAPSIGATLIVTIQPTLDDDGGRSKKPPCPT